MRILGLMSGTSLDGLDLCLCNFWSKNNELKYSIEATTTIEYPLDLLEKLKNCHKFSAEQLLILHNEYGRYCGNIINDFLKDKNRPDIIASHGHTIFHQPENMFTFQIGSGASIMAECGIDTICDFRTSDVAFKGQGAPLVPIGDKLLFGNFDYCLNIGGFANISSKHGSQSIAFDICPANFVLNELTMQLGKPYDEDGQIARHSSVDIELLNTLNRLEYYHLAPPKSLGREWAEKEIFPLLNNAGLSNEMLIATYTEHIAVQISANISKSDTDVRMIATGGGAHNSFLLERISAHSNIEICKISDQIIDFKEALIFALLGYLYMNSQNNCLSEITGASISCIGGALYKAPSRR